MLGLGLLNCAIVICNITPSPKPQAPLRRRKRNPPYRYPSSGDARPSTLLESSNLHKYPPVRRPFSPLFLSSPLHLGHFRHRDETAERELVGVRVAAGSDTVVPASAQPPDWRLGVDRRPRRRGGRSRRREDGPKIPSCHHFLPRYAQRFPPESCLPPSDRENHHQALPRPRYRVIFLDFL